jgi:tetratricopeptide (TPR) repeat protein
MNWLSKLFSKNKKSEYIAEEKTLSKRNWESLDFFSKGKEYYTSKNVSEALLYLDKALEHGFAEDFSYDLHNLYDIRGACLQSLDFHYDAINDFDKSISLEPNNFNKYFSRSVSKGAILDYEGQIADLLTAIRFSKIDNSLNKEYNDQAEMKGYKGATELLEMQLKMAKMSLESEIKTKERIQNAINEETKELLEKIYLDTRNRKLSRAKKRL